MSTTKTYTGRHRRGATRRGVRIADRVAAVLIATGGIGTVVAVSTVCIFLVWVVVPLFMPARWGEPRRFTAGAGLADALHVEPDEYRSVAWAMSREGVLRSFRLDTGEQIAEQPLFPDAPPTAWSFGVGGREAVCGFADGSVRTIRLGFSTTFPTDAELPEELRSIAKSERAVFEQGLLTRTPQGQLRLQSVKAVVSDPVMKAGGAAVERVDSSSRPTGRVCCRLDADGKLSLHAARKRQTLLKETIDSSVVNVDIPYKQPSAAAGPPRHLLLSGQAGNLYLIWDDGTLLRYDLRNAEQPQLAEQIDLIPEPNEAITAVQFLPGKTTLAIGDTLGRVQAWFPAKMPEARTVDGNTFVAAHELGGAAVGVAALACSARARLLAVGYADGSVRVFQVTTDRELVESAADQGQAPRLLAFAPKGDAVLAVSEDSVAQLPLQAGYPEVSVAALFSALWYEGYDGPRHIWQSSGGGDDFETKLGMIPLIFGTLKATIYSLLFAVPIALFSAIYTSEFLHARAKARIKPTIEMMASLPSVVLGFVAALVVAPYVEQVIPAVLAGLAVVPGTFLLAAYLWQLLPPRVSLHLARWRFAFICATLPLGVFLSVRVGPLVERALFEGDLHSWLDGNGDAIGGWLVMLLPLSALAVFWGLTRQVNPFLRRALQGASRERRAFVELLKFLGAAVATIAGAWLAGLALNSLHFDPRGALLDTYVQRNALIVGFVMGFAIIPIIYTIADDALSTVPAHLRSASLGAGATPWQTAVRVIIPTAMSGLFSAVMVGLGRAVGETMIVLMAAGNTPIMDWNIFNGFQTLSASIATELPEAVQGSAHYRTLFVAALALFAMTFVVNTIAEAVRLRFRRRAYEL